MTIPASEQLLKQIMLTIDIAWRNQLDLKVINNWLENFTGEALGNVEEERNLALWLLYNFVYINEEEVKHLCRLLFKKYVRQIVDSECTTLENITKLLRQTKFMGLGKSSESGGYILYLFRQENELPVRFFNEANQNTDYNKYVFLDDMTLSGNQALDRVRKVKYAGYYFEESHINDSFLEKLKLYKEDELTGYIWRKLNCNKKDKTKVAKHLNESIISDLNFYDANETLFKDIKKTESIELLIKMHKEQRLSKLGIYKLNRLLLENYYDNDFVKEVNHLNIKKWVLLTFIASKDAIKKLKNEDVEVISCILIDDMSMAFSDSSIIFKSFPEEKERCELMCKHYGKKINREHPLGYNDGQLLLGLYYTIPNNTLPIFWGNDNWTPLFIRHEKNYTGGIKDVFGKYI